MARFPRRPAPVVPVVPVVPAAAAVAIPFAGIRPFDLEGHLAAQAATQAANDAAFITGRGRKEAAVYWEARLGLGRGLGLDLGACGATPGDPG